MSAEYRDRLYASYVESHVRSRTELTPEAIAARLSLYGRNFGGLLPTSPEAQILDLGCGWGALVKYLRDSGYRNASGIDASAEQVKLAAELGIQGVESGRALERLRQKPAAYDLLFAIDLMEHLRKDEALDLAEAACAALKPGGRFIVHTVNAQGFGWGRIFYGDLTHETAYTPWSLEQLFRAAGFAGASFHPSRPHFQGFRGIIRRFLWALTEQALRTAYHAENGSGLLRGDHVLTPNLIAVAKK